MMLCTAGEGGSVETHQRRQRRRKSKAGQGDVTSYRRCFLSDFMVSNMLHACFVILLEYFVICVCPHSCTHAVLITLHDVVVCVEMREQSRARHRVRRQPRHTIWRQLLAARTIAQTRPWYRYGRCMCKYMYLCTNENVWHKLVECSAELHSTFVSCCFSRLVTRWYEPNREKWSHQCI